MKGFEPSWFESFHFFYLDVSRLDYFVLRIVALNMGRIFH